LDINLAAFSTLSLKEIFIHLFFQHFKDTPVKIYLFSKINPIEKDIIAR
jgi:hypothetical protein